MSQIGGDVSLVRTRCKHPASDHRTVGYVVMLRGLCTLLIGGVSAMVPTAATGPGAQPPPAADDGGQSISVTVPRLVFGAPTWLPMPLYVVEYAAGTEPSTIGADNCSVLADIFEPGCLVRRPDGSAWFVVLAT